MTSRRVQITLQPDVLLWARERAGISRDALARKMQVKIERVIEWEKTGDISIAQADRLAEHTHTPLGLLYLSKPLEDVLPIADFRDTAHRCASAASESQSARNSLCDAAETGLDATRPSRSWC